MALAGNSEQRKIEAATLLTDELLKIDFALERVYFLVDIMLDDSPYLCNDMASLSDNEVDRSTRTNADNRNEPSDAHRRLISNIFG